MILRTGKYSNLSVFHKLSIFLVLVLQTLGRLTYHLLLFLIKAVYIFWQEVFRFLQSLILQLIKLSNKLKTSITIPKKKIGKIKSKPKPSLKKIKKQKIKRQPLIKIDYKKWLIRIFLLFSTSTILLVSALIFYLWILKDLPKPDKLSNYSAPLTTKLYDRNGTLLYKIYRDQNRTVVALDNIPLRLIQATIAIEDKRFFEHNGFSVEGFSRALKRNILNEQIEGGSTITQQLIKNTLLTPEKTLQRKIKELILSFQTELIFNKEEILSMYLNTVPYGGTAYGVEEAAQTYFNKSVDELGLAESALMAGLPAAPSKYSPHGANPELSIIRQHEVLRRMVEDKYITPFEAERAKAEKIHLTPIKNHIKAPHFVMYLKDHLVDRFSLREVEQGGLTVTSSLDLNIQTMAEKAVQEELMKLKQMNVGNGAALVMKPQTGEILAMVGSKDYYDPNIDGNVNVTLQSRQPGSTIKVINYTYALAHGYTAASIISDTPISYHIPGQAPYQPINYDQRFHGNVSLRRALASSYNVPAVKVLASFGVDKMIKQAVAMGISTWNQPERFGLSLTLGGGEVKMIDLASVYAVLANYGNKVDINPIISVKNSSKKNILKNPCQDTLGQKTNPLTCWAADSQLPASNCPSKELVAPGIAFIISDILSDNTARTPAFGPNSLLNIKGHQVAVKTGTTNDKRDNWCIGYTKDYLVAVWVGNNDNQPMSAVASGITGATPIWNKIMTELLRDEPPHKFAKTEDILSVDICSLNGLRACQGCSNQKEFFLQGTEPKYNCNSFEVEKALKQKEKQKENRILEGVSISR